MTETVEEFLARGGEIERLPRGLCNWDALSDRAKINPSVDRAERQARKAADAAVPAPKKPERLPKPAKPPRPKKPDGRKGPRMTKQAKEMLVLIRRHPTLPELAEVTGKSRGNVWTILNNLRKKGLIESNGKARVLTTWRVVDAPVR